MKAHTLMVFVVGLSLPTSLKAAVGEEWNREQPTPMAPAAAAVDLDFDDAFESAPIEPAPQVVFETPEYREERVAEPTVQTVIRPAQQPVAASAAPVTAPAATVAYSRRGTPDVYIETTRRPAPEQSSGMALIPMAGATLYRGAWGENTRNQYSFGLALEIPVSRYFSFEVDGALNRFHVAYTPLMGWPTGYAFNQYLLGGAGKVYLTNTKLRPFVGAGLTAVFYENMRPNDPARMGIPYNDIVGAANLLVGLEYSVSETISLGARGAYLLPVINLPVAVHNGAATAPGFEEPALMQTGFFRLMGTMSVRL